MRANNLSLCTLALRCALFAVGGCGGGIRGCRRVALRHGEGGFSVILAFAGMAAHLAGAMAANTTLPVIGVPCSGTKLDGMDALLSTVQMPSGIPVATVAVDGGKNAALLAVQIMAVSDAELAQKLDEARTRERDAVLRADEEVRALYQ